MVVDANGPGTIVRDFEALLVFLEEQDPPLTPGLQLPRRLLPQINARLSRPLKLGLQQPHQGSYPHIHGLYLLLRASGLTIVAGTAKKPRLVVDEVVRQLWNGLNFAERYCSLLEAWLLRGRPEIIGEEPGRRFELSNTFDRWYYFFRDVPDKGLRVAGDPEVEQRLRYKPGWYNLGLLELFGLVGIQHAPPAPGRGWCIGEIRRTPVGDALLALFYSEFFDDLPRLRALEDQRKAPFGVLPPILQPYWPGCQKSLVLPEWVFRGGGHVFKVSLGAIWRRILLPATPNLDVLAATILDAFDFNRDHLYRFSYRDRFGVWLHVNHPDLEEAPRTDAVRIGDVPLGEGQMMTFLFDFGDCWEFDVTLERVDPTVECGESPRLLARRGKSPRQY